MRSYNRQYKVIVGKQIQLKEFINAWGDDIRSIDRIIPLSNNELEITYTKCHYTTL